MEFMPKGDLHSILHNPEKELSMPRKIQFAIDICQGMAWLAGQNILHRDLKPANVLLDQNWTCKVCDFGLSQVQRGKQKMQDEEEAPGSVLWMAPEVLLNETIDCKLDVYSFALVLWEIMTRQDLFAEYDDKDIFTEDIARKGIRPATKDIHPALEKIITSSWQRDPSKRPTFQELIVKLEHALLEIYLPADLCPDGAKFWAKHWNGKSKTAFQDFTTQLFRYLGKRKCPPYQSQCLEAILAEKEENEQFVTIERFSSLLKWFGKMRVDASFTIVDRLENTMRNDWFFGDMLSGPAEDALKVHKDTPGVFLVRFNMGGGTSIEKTPYTISRIDGNKKLLHTRVYPRKEGSGFFIQAGGKEKTKIKNNSSGIADFITHIQREDPTMCKTPCPGSPYKSIFIGRVISPYEEQKSDEEDEDDD